jgi:hypothetical protein
VEALSNAAAAAAQTAPGGILAWLGGLVSQNMGTTLTIVLTCLTVLLTYRQFVESRAQRTQIFLNIADRWTKIYNDRLKIMALPDTSDAELEQLYGSNYQLLFDEKFWLSMRTVLNFFEIIGVMIHRKYIGRKEVFVLVSVDYYPTGDALERMQLAMGDLDPSLMATLYCKLRPYLLYLRRHYRADIYEFYDDYLLGLYAKRKPLRPRWSPPWPGKIPDPR